MAGNTVTEHSCCFVASLFWIKILFPGALVLHARSWLRAAPCASRDKPRHQHQCWSWSLEFCGCIPELEELFAQGEHLEISFPFFGEFFGKLRALGSLPTSSGSVMIQEWDTPFFQEKGQVEVAKVLMWCVLGSDGIPWF